MNKVWAHGCLDVTLSNTVRGTTFRTLFVTVFSALLVALCLAAPSAAMQFYDVVGGSWYAGYVGWVSDEGVMAGYGDGRFGPDDGLTRSMAATVLYRAATGASPADAYGGESPFDDVAGGVWYSSGIAWAKATGVVTGYGDGRFGPDAPVTREQMATMCARYAAFIQGRDTWSAGLSGHPDSWLVSDWAVEAVSWCGDAGIMNGDSGTGALRPQAGCTRAEAAKMFCVLFGGTPYEPVQMPQSAQVSHSVPSDSANVVIDIPSVGDLSEATYVLNKRSFKFHHTWCQYIDDMSPKNRLYVNLTRDEVIQYGFVPCKVCWP